MYFFENTVYTAITSSNEIKSEHYCKYCFINRNIYFNIMAHLIIKIMDSVGCFYFIEIYFERLI